VLNSTTSESPQLHYHSSRFNYFEYTALSTVAHLARLSSEYKTCVTRLPTAPSGSGFYKYKFRVDTFVDTFCAGEVFSSVKNSGKWKIIDPLASEKEACCTVSKNLTTSLGLRPRPSVHQAVAALQALSIRRDFALEMTGFKIPQCCLQYGNQPVL